jgi:aminopeptidase YwaD
MLKQIYDKIQKEVSGDVAFFHVSEIVQHHRIQVSPGIREAVNYSVNAWRKYGVDAKVKSWPSTGKEFAWTSQMPLEWSCEDAELSLIEPADQARSLARFLENKISLIQRSFPTRKEGVEAEVVIMDKGEEEIDYKKIDVSGKIVLTSGDVARVNDLAVQKYGAVGIICDGMFVREPSLKEGELDDALKYTSFWWSGDEKPCWGFVLSPRTGRWLRRLIEKSKTPVKLRAKVDSKFYPGVMEDAIATIEGKSSEEVTVVAHICHPQPSANDNASGSGAAMEAARALHKLISTGELEKPKRTIRFTLVPEIAGSYPWLVENEKRLSELIAAINLDMVGENQTLCGGPLIMERTPEASASYVNTLLEAIYDEVKKEAKNLSGSASYPLFKHVVTPYSGGSDHGLYSDPFVGIPCPMIIQWPDKFYHTSFDTLDKVDPEMLRKVALITATYAYYIANASKKDALWLASETANREKIRLLQKIQVEVNKAIEGDEASVARIIDKLKKLTEYWAGRATAAVKSVKTIAPNDKDVERLCEQYAAEIEEISKKEWKKAENAINLINTSKGLILTKPKKKRLTKIEKETKKVVVKRLYKGTLSTRYWMKKLSPIENEAWREYGKLHPDGRSVSGISLYWCDGKRNLLEVSNLVEFETGKTDTEYLLKHYQTMEKIGLVKLQTIQ